MKNILTFSLVFLGLTLFSQDISKMLQANKWYAKYDTKTMKMIYSKKTTVSNQESYEFRENGKIVWCGMAEESSLDAHGLEKKSTHFICDSIRKYEVKNGMLMTQLLKQTPEYFKLAMKGETVELTPIKAEQFNK